MIHQYRLNGYNIVLDVHSSSVHVVDDVMYDLIEKLTNEVKGEIPQNVLNELSLKYSEEEILESYDEIKAVYDKGTLFAEDTYEEFANKMTSAPIKSLCLNVAHDCNLRCDYCFAAKGDFGQGRMLMPFEVGREAIDFLLRNSDDRRNLEVDFFGGEPLMNFNTVKQIVSYARSKEKEYRKNFRFTITTNGMLLDEDKINYINNEMSNVVLSLDGRREVHDKLRVTPTGKGSYDRILSLYQKLVNERGDKDYYVRGTFTKNNLDFSQDVIAMKNFGFEHVSVEPVVSDPKLDYSINESDLPRIFDEYEELARQVIKHKEKGENLNFFHFMIDLDAGPCVIKRLRGCSCGNEYIAITPTGDVFPCHQFVGENKWRMGNVMEKTFNTELKKFFSETNIYKKEKCKNCWAKFYCSGGCNANNWQYNKDIFSPHEISCELEKKRLECAIMLKVYDLSHYN